MWVGLLPSETHEQIGSFLAEVHALTGDASLVLVGTTRRRPKALTRRSAPIPD
jgi:hypothetical protein